MACNTEIGKFFYIYRVTYSCKAREKRGAKKCLHIFNVWSICCLGGLGESSDRKFFKISCLRLNSVIILIKNCVEMQLTEQISTTRGNSIKLSNHQLKLILINSSSPNQFTCGKGYKLTIPLPFRPLYVDIEFYN